MKINEIAVRQFDWVERMGWHNKTVLEAIALIGSEIGEAAGECMGTEPTAAYGEELADVVLRTVDLAQWQGIDLEAALKGMCIEWVDTSLRGGFAELMVDVACWVNTARKSQLGEDFTHSLARVMRRIMDMAERSNIDLEKEVLRKMAINEVNGTRGRRI